jgi:UDP-GlcNAc:undecaprenyl-phosphate/decaprenyl-phosphate GlcNAc-1-phosphate transferase
MMFLNFLFTALIGFLLGIIILFWLRRSALKYKFLTPNGIPFVGGIAIGAAFLLTCLLVLSPNIFNQAKGFFWAALIILIMGIIDDFRELSILAKLLIQAIATSLLILFGISTQIVYIGNVANIIITFIWVLGITNAFNHLDIVDGLAIATAVTISFAFFIISFLNGDIKAATLSLALAGAGLSFLIHNLPPAKVYMGNSGSHFLGFVLAAVALLISYAPLERGVALFTPLVILWLPIFDTSFLVFIRMSKKRLPFNKSNDHLVLRLLAIGFSKKKALLILFALGIFFACSGVLLSQVPNWLGVSIFALIILLSLYVSYRMSRVEVSG